MRIRLQNALRVHLVQGDVPGLVDVQLFEDLVDLPREADGPALAWVILANFKQLKRKISKLSRYQKQPKYQKLQ